MPNYLYWCAECVEYTNRWSTYEDRARLVECRQCGARVALAPPTRINVQTGSVDFVTSDITGKPVRIESRGMEEALCQKHGVRRLEPGEYPGIDRGKHDDAKTILRKMPTFKEDCERMARETGQKLLIPKKGKKRRKTAKAG